MTGRDETDAARLAEALFEIDIDRDNPGGLTGRAYEDVAAALLSVVRELQAEALEAAADRFATGWYTAARDLRDRAAALRGEAGR